MGVLFIMPEWSAPSERYIQRMIEALEPNVVAIAARSPTEPLWRGRIPAIPLLNTPPALERMRERDQSLDVEQIVRRASAATLEQVARHSSTTSIVVHYFTFALLFESVWNKIEKPVFVQCHNYDVSWDGRSHERPDQPMFSQDYPMAVRRLGHQVTTFANSEFSRKRLIDAGFPAEKIIIKTPSVRVPGEMQPRLPKKRDLCVLYMGRLVDFRGPDIVIRAFERACELGFDGRLKIVGDGPLRTSCELLRARSVYANKITLLGNVSEADEVELLREADIFTTHNCEGPLSRQQEAFDMRIVEAMAFGLPIVSTNHSAVQEIVTTDSGLLVTPMDINAHSASLLFLSENPDARLQMSMSGWKRAAKYFDWNRERTQLWDVLGLGQP